MRSANACGAGVAGVVIGAALAFGGGEERPAEALEAVFARGEWPRAIELCDAILAERPDDAQALYRKGFALHALGRLDEALVWHERAAAFPGIGATAAYNAACVLALRGEPDAAFEWLDRAAAAGFDQRAHAGRDADLESLRADPRFAAFLERLGPEGARPLTSYATVTERMGARLAFYDGKVSPGQLHLDWGKVGWDDAFDAKLGSGELDGRRWRFGKDFWTSLDASDDVDLGGVTIPAGLHFLALERTPDGRDVLVVLDPEKVRAHSFDPSVAHLTRFVGGTEIELRHRRVDPVAETLRLEFVPSEDVVTEGEFRVRFGPHEWTAPYVVHVR